MISHLEPFSSIHGTLHSFTHIHNLLLLQFTDTSIAYAYLWFPVRCSSYILLDLCYVRIVSRTNGTTDEPTWMLCTRLLLSFARNNAELAASELSHKTAQT